MNLLKETVCLITDILWSGAQIALTKTSEDLLGDLKNKFKIF